MKRNIAMLLVVAVVLLVVSTGIAIAAGAGGFFRVEMGTLAVLEPIEVLEYEAWWVDEVFPGEILGTARLTVRNVGRIPYLIQPIFSFRAEPEPEPWIEVWTTVAEKAGERTYSPWEAIFIHPKETLILAVEIRVAHTSPPGEVRGATLEFFRMAPPSPKEPRPKG